MKHFKTETLVAFLILLLGVGCKQSAENSNSKKVKEIHQEILTIDTHTDTPLNLTNSEFDIGKKHSYKSSHTCIDFPRMKEGGMDATFFAVFIAQQERTPKGYRQARKRANLLFSEIRQVTREYSGMAELALSPEDAYRIEKEGKRAIYIGVENGYPLGKDLSYIDKYYRKGARYITLCHSSNNDICDSSTDPEGPDHNGLSNFGRKVVQKMNRIGMIVDVSHISDKAFFDVVELSEAPVMASHSCVRAY